MRHLEITLALLALAGAGCATFGERRAMSPHDGSPLQGARLCGFAATSDAARAKAFYVGQLGLKLVEEDHLALVLDAGGQMVRVQKIPGHRPQPFTVLGWNVADVETTVARLARAGVACMRVPGIPQSDAGIATFPDGTRVAWMKDPDENVLSLAQFPR